MKKLLVNIFKTLFFFDLAVICFTLLPTIKTENPALLKLYTEGVQLGFMIFLTIIFIIIERRSIKLPSKKKKVKQVFFGAYAGVALPVITVATIFVAKGIKFEGINKIEYLYFWIPALLLNAVATELLLRGYLFQLYKREYGVIASVVITTLLYLSLNSQIFKMGKIYVITMVVLNILLAALLEYSGSMVVTVTARFFYSLLSTFLLGSLPLSEGYPVLLKTQISGSDYLTGGANGIEGSIIPIIIIGVFTVFWAWRKYKPIALIKNLINKIKTRA